MHQKCSILRDLAATGGTGPFERGGRLLGGLAAEESAAASEPRIDVADMTKAEIEDVSRDPRVHAVAPVMPTRLVEPREGAQDQESEGGTTWGVRAVGAHASARTGAGVGVAVLDTGIDADHPAFAGVEVVERDFTGSGNGDRQGHGTHCAGTVFGREVDGTRIGVAPGVERALIGKVLGDDGSGDSEMILKGIQWAAEEGAQVISMSLGYDFPGLVAHLVAQGWPPDLATSSALEAYRANLRLFDALMNLLRARAALTTGTLVVAAAGNESRREVDPDYEIGVALPAAAEGVVSVGALGASSEGLVIAPFSNTFPRISAPGVDVVSARTGGGLTPLSGTSMACPHVAGVAALWWEHVLDSKVPHTARTVLSKLYARADREVFASGTDVPDRGVGLVQAP